MDQIVEKNSKTWQRRKQARPGEILDAALAVFADKGFAAARMEDIAAKAGVTKGTIYLYFQSKEEVFKSLARQHVSDSLAMAAEEARRFEGSTFDFLSVFLQRCASMILTSEAVALPKIIISESGNFPELAVFWRKEVIDKTTAMLSGVISKGIARGEIRDVPPEYVAKLCMAPMLLGLIWRTTFAHTDDTPFDYEAFMAMHRDVLHRGLRAEGQAA
ncbi:MAG: TetR/AcrR family transcriptional regulator [Rhizomicrobium sp.]|nr:TetR/AcrR family transcriptional regulator [Rhizomicrobium sp.]